MKKIEIEKYGPEFSNGTEAILKFESADGAKAFTAHLYSEHFKTEPPELCVELLNRCCDSSNLISLDYEDLVAVPGMYGHFCYKRVEVNDWQDLSNQFKDVPRAETCIIVVEHGQDFTMARFNEIMSVATQALFGIGNDNESVICVDLGAGLPKGTQKVHLWFVET